MVKVAVQIDSPRSVLFAILNDYARFGEWIPGCERCSVATTAGNVTTAELVLNSMKKITIQVRYEAEPDQLIRFEMLSSQDVKAYVGCYKLMNAANGGTVFTTELDLDAGPMAPKFIADRVLKTSLEATGEALRKRVKTMPQAPAAPVVNQAPSEKKARATGRTKTLLRVVRTESGDRIWYAGKTYGPE